MLKQTTTATLLIVLASALPATLLAADNRISADIESMDVMHNGQTVTIQRGHDRDAILPAMFQKTDRGCPPFCVQPIVALPGVGTIGELEMLDYLNRKSKGDDSILVVDSRAPQLGCRRNLRNTRASRFLPADPRGRVRRPLRRREERLGLHQRQDPHPLLQRHLVRAVYREYQDLGRSRLPGAQAQVVSRRHAGLGQRRPDDRQALNGIAGPHSGATADISRKAPSGAFRRCLQS